MRRADNLPTVLKSGNLNLLEPSGPVQGRNGIALLLPSNHVFRFCSSVSFGALLSYVWDFLYFSAFFVLFPSFFSIRVAV